MSVAFENQKEVLEALYNGKRVGQLHYAKNLARFSYTEEWTRDPAAFPISLSMPLAQKDHTDQVVRPFVAGLLPDSDAVLNQWSRRFQVSRHNPFKLLEHIGEECAGGIQFVPPDRLPKWLSHSPPSGVDWLTEEDFVERIERLGKDGSASRKYGDAGHFSLAGAQVKTALYRDPIENRWGVPKGITPTTHIIKPNTGNFDSFELNEHYCLKLAHSMGLKAAASWTEIIGTTPVIIVERYDRIKLTDKMIRIHQEDCCQALSRPPEKKYQNEGGPSATELFQLIRNHSSKPHEDVIRLLDALIFNYLVCGTDAHAKNFSLLIAGKGQVRLAPLYDLISILPYEQYEPRKTKLAMKIGGHYRLWEIGKKQWQKAAKEWQFDQDFVIDRLYTASEKLKKAAHATRSEMPGQAHEQNRFLDELAKLISDRADSCSKKIADQNSRHGA